MGVDNLQWRKAKRVAGNAFIGFDSGWPVRMDALQLARLQRPLYLEPVSADFGHKEFFVGYFPHTAHPDNQAHRELLAFLNSEFEAGNGPDTPHLFAAWLVAQRETPSTHIQAWFDAWGVTGAKEHATPAKPLQRFQAQDAAILQEIKKQNLDPLALPRNPPGKPGVKAAIRDAIDGKGIFAGNTVFDKSWERLRTAGTIATKD